MKLNKKVLTGALALAMGLGVAAPAVNSFAAKADSTMEIVEKEYRAAGEAWLKAYNELEDARAIEKDFDDKIEAAKKVVQEAVNNEIDAKKLNTDEEEKVLKEATAAKVKAQDAYDEENDKLEGYKDPYVLKKLKEDLDAAEAAVNKAQEALDAKTAENDKAVEEAEKATLEAKDALDEIENAKAEKMITVDGEEKNIADALEALEEKQTETREAFKAQGANDAIIEVMKKLGDVVLPDDEAVEEEEENSKEELIEEIKAQLEVNKEKLAAAKGVKMYMPESYKLYKDRIDTAIANAEKAIKQAEDFLAANKKVALFSVAYAAEEENTEAEDVLKDLQDSEKELDSVLGDIEKDSKEENDKNEEKEEEEKEDDKNEEKEEDKKEEKEDDKVVVEKKEDVKASKNVKTGVAGVAGVGAVLAAASAAYVSSKRK